MDMHYIYLIMFKIIPWINLIKVNSEWGLTLFASIFLNMLLFSQTTIYAWTKIVGLTMDDILIEESQKRVQQPILAGKSEFQIKKKKVACNYLPTCTSSLSVM